MGTDAHDRHLASRSREFIGRVDEIGRLERLLQAAAGGTPNIVLVRGESGVGKSRLLTQFVGHRTPVAGHHELDGGDEVARVRRGVQSLQPPGVGQMDDVLAQVRDTGSIGPERSAVQGPARAVVKREASIHNRHTGDLRPGQVRLPSVYVDAGQVREPDQHGLGRAAAAPSTRTPTVLRSLRQGCAAMAVVIGAASSRLIIAAPRYRWVTRTTGAAE